MINRIAVILILATSLLRSSLAQPVTDATALFNEMMTAVRNTHTCSFIISLTERSGGSYHDSEYLVRMQSKPLQVYAYSIHPNPGAEALYIEGTMNGKALINPNRFPYINLNLSPYNYLMRKNHHYTMLQSGFLYLQNLMENYIQREGERFYKLWKILPDTVIANKRYLVLAMDNPEFSAMNYRVKPGETVSSIAERMLVNDHMILDLNPNVSGYDGVHDGQVIRVPNSFARRLRFYLDPGTLLPLIQEVYDDKGLYNKVVFSSFVLNPEFSKLEFDRDNPRYHF